MLIIQSLSMAYGQRTLWSDVGLTAEPGTITAIVGPSGSGKSTLLNCVGLLAKPDSGSIHFKDRDILSMSARAERRFRRSELGYLFQNYALIEDATVEANLKVALRAKKLRGGAARAAMRAALEQVGLESRLRDPVAQLSGGEQQRVALARLLVRSPTLVLADEPTGALDEMNRDRVMEHLRTIAERGAVVLIATHDHDVQAACDNTLDVSASGASVLVQPPEHPRLIDASVG